MISIENECLKLRYELCVQKIKEIKGEDLFQEPLLSYFQDVACFIDRLITILERDKDELEKVTEEELASENKMLYLDVVGDNYEKSYANPEFITGVFEKEDLPEYAEHAKYLCFLYAEIRGLIPFAYESDVQIFTIYVELFLEIYTMYRLANAEGEYPLAEHVGKTLYWFERDNCDIVVPDRINKQVNPQYDFITNIVMNEDINNTRYLYLYGEYVSDDELKMSRFLNTLTDEQIQSMADTFTEGYRIGFVKAGKPIHKKTSVNIRYSMGFERITRASLVNFRKMGLEPVIYRAATLSLNKRGVNRIGFIGTAANHQYDYDHKDDEAIYLDADFVTRKIEALREGYENLKQLANGHAGPACQEVFGEETFVPKDKNTAVIHNDKTRKLVVDYQARSSEIVNEYIIGEERSFTIIAYPCASIGDDFENIFHDTVKLNTLDYKTYENIQQRIIDKLDKCERVHVLGKGNNRTDLVIELYKIEDGAKQTKFENCVADVNIPVGEVFTSPVLKGTNGVLHVTSVYLNELLYKDFELVVEDGMIKKYSCHNFEDNAKNEKYIKDNFLYSHQTLPIGEFAIGTNTVAYKMARDYKIEALLPILIGEKTGPHFAFGDTCYSHEEDVAVYNPDGKEIVARENEISAKRKEDMKNAYFQCHTDVTIPYDELGEIYGQCGDTKIYIFKDGQFVIEGCEELNIPLKQ